MFSSEVANKRKQEVRAGSTGAKVMLSKLGLIVKSSSTEQLRYPRETQVRKQPANENMILSKVVCLETDELEAAL